MKARVCKQCGTKNDENAWSCSQCGDTLSIDTVVEVSENHTKEDAGWECKNCGNFNVGVNQCPKCGKDKNFVPEQSSSPPKRSKADELYEKGWKSFWDGFAEPDNNKRIGNLSRAQGYLTMAYKVAGDDIEDKKGIAGLMAYNLVLMEDFKNAEDWARAELSINPSHVITKLAWYFIEVHKLVGHKGFILQNDGSGLGAAANLVTGIVDIGRFQGKKVAVRKAAIEAAKSIENRVQADPEPDPREWLLWSGLLFPIIDSMWAGGMKEPYLCNVLLNLPWDRFTEEQLKDIREDIEEMQVEIHGYLGRLR